MTTFGLPRSSFGAGGTVASIIHNRATHSLTHPPTHPPTTRSLALSLTHSGGTVASIMHNRAKGSAGSDASVRMREAV